MEQNVVHGFIGDKKNLVKNSHITKVDNNYVAWSSHVEKKPPLYEHLFTIN
jgi:hypothetical protein